MAEQRGTRRARKKKIETPSDRKLYDSNLFRLKGKNTSRVTVKPL